MINNRIKNLKFCKKIKRVSHFQIFKFSNFVAITCLIFLSQTLLSQTLPKKEKPVTRILFIFDASQSMIGQWNSGVKMDIAKKMFSHLLDSLNNIENLELGLRVYGHQKPYPPGDCNDTRLEIPFGKFNVSRIKSKMETIQPNGTTPIANALKEAANDFKYCNNCRNLIILITDGLEMCEGDPCAVSLDLQKKGIVIKPFIIGVGLDESAKSAFECVGKYYDAATEESFNNILRIVITQVLDETSCQINLLDEYNKPTETNIPMTFYDQLSGKIKYNYVHTMNQKGNPDTLVLDALTNYKLIVHTIPPLELDSIELTQGKHNIIPIRTPQGSLFLDPGPMSEYKDLICLIRKAGDDKTLHVQKIKSAQKYLTGKYDIEILSIPRLNINGVEIKQSHTTTVQIPQPGILSISFSSPGFSQLLKDENGNLNSVYTFSENISQENLQLLPGKYKVIYRPKSAKETIYSIEQSLIIEAGKSISIKF
jgi:Ca-activated chloride channel family protein